MVDRINNNFHYIILSINFVFHNFKFSKPLYLLWILITTYYKSVYLSIDIVEYSDNLIKV